VLAPWRRPRGAGPVAPPCSAGPSWIVHAVLAPAAPYRARWRGAERLERHDGWPSGAAGAPAPQQPQRI